MTASADVVVDVQEDVLKVPLSAVGVIRGHTYVKPHDTHEPVEVVLGVRNESVAEVLEGVELGEELDLGWLQEKSTVLDALAGKSAVPEHVARAIIAQGDRYGQVSPVQEIAGMEEMMEGMIEGMRQRGGRMGDRPEGGFERVGAGSDSSRAVRFAGRTGAEPDSARTAQMVALLMPRMSSLPDSLRSELLMFIEGGARDFRSLSPALTDSIRAWGVMGRGRQSRTPPPDDGKMDFEGDGK
jgi:hypothetical protein